MLITVGLVGRQHCLLRILWGHFILPRDQFLRICIIVKDTVEVLEYRFMMRGLCELREFRLDLVLSPSLCGHHTSSLFIITIERYTLFLSFPQPS